MTSDTNNTTKFARKYYALHWYAGSEFEYDYDTIPNLDILVAAIVVFNNKSHRDQYVDRWHCAESIPASIAHKLIKNGVSYCEGV